MIGLRKSAVALVTDLLEAQRAALLSGDLARLGGMEEAISRAFERLRRDGAGPEDLARIRAAAVRNASLLRAAQTGVAQARAHLGAARSTPLSTYDASGRSRASAPAASRTLSRG